MKKILVGIEKGEKYQGQEETESIKSKSVHAVDLTTESKSLVATQDSTYVQPGSPDIHYRSPRILWVIEEAGGTMSTTQCSPIPALQRMGRTSPYQIFPMLFENDTSNK